MSLSIEIRSNYVHLLEAKTNKNGLFVKKTFSYDFPEQWITEKGIVEGEAFANLLNQSLKENGFTDRHCSLCLNNASILSRELIIPKVDARKIPLIVRSELISTLNLTPQYVVDFIELENFEEEGNPVIRVLAVASLKSAIESYLEVCKLCNLKLDEIDSATNGLIKFASRSQILTKDDQIIVADIGKDNLRLYLFEHQKYILTRTTKLNPYASRTQDEIVEIIEDNLNKMIQFSFTRNDQRGIKTIILIGIDELLPELKIRVEKNLNVSCKILDKPNFISNKSIYETRYVNTMGVLLRNKHDMNLLLSFQAELKYKKNQTSSAKLYLAIILASLLILSAYAVSLILDSMRYARQIETLEAFINSPSTLQKLSDVNHAQDNLVRLDQIESQVDVLNKSLEDVPRFSSEILNLIIKFKPDAVHVDKLEFNLSYVMIDFHEHLSSTAAQYVLDLQESNAFLDVSYVGYVYDPLKKIYTGKIMVSLKGGQENEAQ